MLRRKLGLVARGVAASVLVAGAAHAVPIPVTFFHSPSDDGSEATLPLIAPNGDLTINLWADPTSASGGKTFGVQDVVLRASGAVTVVSFTCDSGQGGCLAAASTATEVKFTAGDEMDGNSAVFPIGSLVLNVTGVGTLELTSGTSLGGDFVVGDIIPHLVVSFAIPEPTLVTLLAFALAGLVFGARRSA
jgi:hypothetical protein